MKTLKYLPALGILSISSFIIGCDGGSSGDATGATDGLNQDVVRGISLAEIRANPNGTPGFPFTLSRGETITFTPDAVVADSFLEQVPLGTWTANTSGFVQQNAGPTGTLDYPIGENSFTYFYGTSNTSADPATVSTQVEAFLQYTFDHSIDNAASVRQQKFNIPLSLIYNSSSEPGSLQYVLRNGGLATTVNRVIVNAISSAGFSAVVHPTFLTPAVRTQRFIILSDIASINSDISRPNPFIEGRYTIVDEWAIVDTTDTEAPVTLEHGHSGGNHLSTDTEFEIETGTFRIDLDEFDYKVN